MEFLRINTVILIFSLFCVVTKGQESDSIMWRCKVINSESKGIIPNAIIAVYSEVALYSTGSNGHVMLYLPKNDSVRVVMMGYASKVFRISDMRPDATGYAPLPIDPIAYTLKEVIIKPYKGILDPSNFPKREDGNSLDLNLPDGIGSNMSKLPPSERLTMEKPSPLALLVNPASYVYSQFSKEQKLLRKFRANKSLEQQQGHLQEFITSESIALISGFEDEELEKFIIYCNIHLKLSKQDNGASVIAQLQSILEKYKTEQNKNP